MKLIALVGTVIVAAGAGLAAGFFIFSQRPPPAADFEVIAAAQRTSTSGADPVWLNAVAGERARFRQIRNRAYAYCYRDGMIGRACADEQDEAAWSAILSLRIADDRRHMPDKSSLGPTERWIAENFDVEVRARAYCWSIYNAHGGQDARILGTCLGNIGVFQPIVQMPVFD